MDHFAVFICVNTYKFRLESDLKLNTNFETALPQQIGGVGRKYIFVLESFAPSPRYSTQYENIFFFLTTSQYVKPP